MLNLGHWPDVVIHPANVFCNKILSLHPKFSDELNVK